MTDRPQCSAYRMGDQMTCPRCPLTWDIDDPNPPACKSRALTPRPRPLPYQALGPNIHLGTRRPRYLRK